MDMLRNFIDQMYVTHRDRLFAHTREDPEIAHEKFARFARFANRFHLDKLLFDNSSNSRKLDFELTNAAGFVKNAEVHPHFMKYLGFDRMVVGSVTHDPYNGNERPRIWRDVKTESMINYLGLPNIGSKRIAERLEGYGQHGVPITINVTPTPGKSFSDGIHDVVESVKDLQYDTYVDRFELNISCPNTVEQIDDQLEYVNYMISAMKHENIMGFDLDLKVSPDMEKDSVRTLIDLAAEKKVRNLTICNTTRIHDPSYFENSPGRGGASGNALYIKSLRCQSFAQQYIFDKKYNLGITAVGGIDSVDRLYERLEVGANGMQVFTPLIFRGPGLLREFRDWGSRMDFEKSD